MNIGRILGQAVQLFVTITSLLDPLLTAFGQLMPVLTKFRDQLRRLRAGDDVGKAIDDFVDRYTPQILVVRTFAIGLELVASQLKNVCDRILAAASDDTVTVDEGMGIIDEMEALINGVGHIVKESPNTKAAIAELTAGMNDV